MVLLDESAATFLPTLAAQQDAMLALLETLVNHESPSSDLDANRAALELYAPVLSEALGRDVELVVHEGRTHLVARPVGGAGCVMLVGHIDTVWPTGTVARWPYSLDGDHITGPGCFDMKAGLVQQVFALRALRDAGVDLSRVAVVTNTDEEIGSITSRALIEEVAKQCTYALVLEPSAAGELKIARKGVSMYRLDVQGRASHAGLEPEKGANALLGLAHVLLSLPGAARMDIGTSVTPTVAAAGTTSNTVPANAHVLIDVRAESVDEQLRVDGELRALTSPVPDTTVVLDGGSNRPPLEAKAAEQLFALSQEVAARQGITAFGAVSVGGGSDGNFTAGVGVQTLDGLGAVGDKAHAEGEWVSASAMPERAALVAGLIAELLSR